MEQYLHSQGVVYNGAIEREVEDVEEEMDTGAVEVEEDNEDDDENAMK